MILEEILNEKRISVKKKNTSVTFSMFYGNESDFCRPITTHLNSAIATDYWKFNYSLQSKINI